MNKMSFGVLVVVLMAGAGFACEDNGAGPVEERTDTETETGSGPEGTDPACDEDGGAKGDPCDLEDLCDCDHLCGYQLWSEKKDGGKAAQHQCFARCEPKGPACAGASEVCWPRGKQPAVCLPTGQVSIPSFESKVYEQDAKPGLAELVVTGANAAATFGGETLPTGYAAWGIEAKDGKNISLSFALGEQNGSEVWVLGIVLPAGKWTPGTYKVGGFSATLLRSELDDQGKVTRTFYEASAAQGTLTLEKTPAVCAVVEGCARAKGSLSLELLGLPTELSP